MSNTTLPAPAVSAQESDGLSLRPSMELSSAPSVPLASAAATPPAAPARVTRATSAASDSQILSRLPALAIASEPWLLMSLFALASAGWLLERRRRRRLQTEKDSVLWADVQARSSIITTLDELPEMLPESERAALAPSLPPVLGQTASRREATLVDLHQLDGKLRRRRARGDLLGAVAQLQHHLADFRYTSPWVFLELREVHHLLGRQQDWEAAREAFQMRFAQKAPVWQAPSTADAQLADDPDICGELVTEWPYREARMVVLRWMLGDADTGHIDYRPPVLALGVYRDLLFIDRVLDRMMIVRPPPQDSLL